MGENGCASRVQPLVAVGVVEVPMRVDQMLDWVGTDRRECGCDFWARTRISGVDEQFTFPTVKDGNISTRAQEDTDIAAKLLHVDSSVGRCSSGCRTRPSSWPNK